MLARQVRAALEAGWRVTCLLPPGPLTDVLRAAGATCTALPTIRLGHGGRIVKRLRLARNRLRAAWQLRGAAQDANVVLAMGIFAMPVVSLARLRAPAVLWLHDVLVSPERIKLVRRYGRSLALIVGVSESVLTPIRGVAPSIALRNGVDQPQSLRSAPPLEFGPFVVGCAGALVGWKGQHVLLEALGELGDLDIRLELMGVSFSGDESYELRLHERSEQPDLRGRVRFSGFVAEPLRTMAGWHVGVSPSVEPEASGLTVLEGMSIGLPFVCTDHGGPPEILGGAGLLVPPEDPVALAAAIRALVEDRGLWTSCSEAGPVIVRERADRREQEGELLCALIAISAG
jgi:glycosyltransferase involved in cell wall biosynthesis